jgi:hypothetical protein
MSNEDLDREFQKIEDARNRLTTQAELLAINWRRLRVLREDLARNLAAKESALSRQPVDPIDIRKTLMAAYEARIRHQKDSVDYTYQELKILRQTLGWRTFLSFQGRRRLRAAHLKIIQVDNELAALENGRIHVESNFREQSERVVGQNRRKNAEMEKPLTPIRDRLKDLTSALDAASSADEAAISALSRWDLPAMIKVARIWHRMKDGEYIGSGDREYRLSVIDPSRGQEMQEPHIPSGLFASMMEILMRSVNTNGHIIDADWQEVHTQDIPKRRALPPPDDSSK